MTKPNSRTRTRTAAPKPRTSRVAFASLGCPKALVDSERILTRLRGEGYEIAPDYAGADVVVVNTCGFLDSARAESLDAIGAVRTFSAYPTRSARDLIRHGGA